MDKTLQAKHAEEARIRKETVNAARAYERCIANRHATFEEAVKAKQAGQDIASIRAIFEIKTHAIHQSALILSNQLKRLTWENRALVDGVFYAMLPHGGLMRVVLADLKDWGAVRRRDRKIESENEP